MTSEFCIALHALIYLEHHEGMISSDVLADNICTNPVRVRKIMALLKKAGLVETREGTDGGYRALYSMEKIALPRVAQAVSAKFVTVNWHSGSMDKPCMISAGMADVMDRLTEDMDRACYGYLDGRTLADVDAMLMARGEAKK